MQDIVIYLNGERGLATLERIVAEGHGVARVIVPGPLAGADVAGRAEAAGVPVEAVADVNDAEFVAGLAESKPRLGLIAGFSSIFQAPLIAMPQSGTVNLHAGPLPGYRGGSPLNWQLINGETTAGISVIRIDEGIDTGPVLAAGEFPIEPDDTIAELHEKANRLFPELVLRVLEGLDDGTLIETPQDETKARYWRQRKPADGRIDWRRMTAADVRNLVRAVTRPYPGAFTQWEGRTVRVFAAALVNGAAAGEPGQVAAADGPLVACRDGWVRLVDYDVDGDAGAALPEGARLGEVPS
ncbi:MAG: methionyl-tRNA formyltransferase [Rhodospirillales bacterium]